MIIYAFLIGAVVLPKLSLCYPNEDLINIPKVQVTSPQEINNLSSNESTKSTRSLDKDFGNPNNNVEVTVKQVEDLLKSNPKLPRLTRGEILDILENITITDQKKLNKSREDYKKALMLVMPYTPEKIDDGVVDLYTKPPITKIVGNKDASNNRQRKPVVTTKISISESSGQEAALPLINLFPDIKINNTVVAEKSKTEENPSVKPVEVRRKTGNRRRRPPLANPVSLSTTTTTTVPEKSVITSTTTTTTTTTTNVPITTYKPKTTFKHRKPTRRRTTTTTTITTPKYANHKYPEDNTDANAGIAFVNAPNLSLNKEDSYSKEEILKEGHIHRNNYEPSYFDNDQSYHETNDNLKIDDGIIIYESHENEHFDEKSPNFDIPKQYHQKQKFDGVQDYQKQTGVDPNDNIKTAEYKKPSSLPQRRKKPTKKPIVDEISIPDDLKTVIEDLDLDKAVNLNRYQNKPNQKNKQTTKASFTTTTIKPIPDVSSVADNLSPDMRELLMSFGLIPDPGRKQEKPLGGRQGLYADHAHINPDSYVSFKPLPDSAPTKDDMEAFFASFGLGRGGRKQKALKVKEENRGFNTDMVPEEYKSLLGEMGFAGRDDRKIRTNTLNKTVEKHVFNPSDSQYASEEELDKLNKLLDMIKQLEKLNGTATEEDLKKIDMNGLKELVGSLNKEEFVPLNEKEAPNPLNFEYGIEKNEVKREENSTGSTTTEESKTPSLKDLEDSFGGSSDTTSEAPPETTTASKRTGFYYLVDWNTFLDIDNQKGKRVNLRFQPTIGDPKRFLSVSVP